MLLDGRGFSGRVALRGLLLALALLCAVPGAASAGTAKLVHEPGDERTPDSERFDYAAAPGETNHLTLSPGPGTSVLVVDSAGVTLGRGCTRPVPGDNTRALCTVPGGLDLSGVSVALGDGADVARDSSLGAEIDGGPGNDDLTGGSLKGGPGNDVLAGASYQKGGPGNDRMTGTNRESYDLFDETDAGNGTDTINGGGGDQDIVTYADRTAPVHVDLEGDRDDGEAGENDQVGSDIESIDGGKGADVLLGSDKANDISGYRGTDRIVGGRGNDNLYADNIVGPGPGRSKDSLNGGPGNDDIEGSRGANVIKAGTGEDDVAGYGGRDVINSRDRSYDSVSCGNGRDLLKADAKDFFGHGCERVRRKGTARAIPLRIYTNPQSDEGPVGEIGCPADGPRHCRGTVTVVYKGKRRDKRRFQAKRGRIDFVSFKKKLGTLTFKYVRLVVRTRDRRGRLKTVSRRMYVDSEG